MIARRYAKALFQITPAAGLEKRMNTLAQFLGLVNRYPHFFYSPQIAKESKEKALKKIPFEDEELKNFLFLLIDKRRFSCLPEIVKIYSQMAGDQLGVVKAQLVLAEKVDARLTEKLKGKLEKKYGKKVLLEAIIDPRLIGGGVLTVGNRLADFSIKGKLERLKRFINLR